MKVALVNPPWSFEGSIYFGCREPHLPLELGYCDMLLRADGHATLMLDCHLFNLTIDHACQQIAQFGADMTVVTTAPSYLFWRCAPPELRVPAQFLRALGNRGGRTVVVGPHGSVTPAETLRKLGADAVVRGECEVVIAKMANEPEWTRVGSLALRSGTAVTITGGPAVSAFVDLPRLRWPDEWVHRRKHHHHRFDKRQMGSGAEVEASRGCPYACSFCAKIDFRDQYRRRDLSVLLDEIDGLISQGVQYIYFIDEIFLPQRALLDELVRRDVSFGMQTRIDLWKHDFLKLLGEAGCVSIEAGIESVTAYGRHSLEKNCRLDTSKLAALLVEARRHVPFVQANLILVDKDDPDLIDYWRNYLMDRGVWANVPVPLYPYPSSPIYRSMWGEPDDAAWERAHEYYLKTFVKWSDVQDERPLPLFALESECFGDK